MLHPLQTVHPINREAAPIVLEWPEVVTRGRDGESTKEERQQEERQQPPDIRGAEASKSGRTSEAKAERKPKLKTVSRSRG